MRTLNYYSSAYHTNAIHPTRYGNMYPYVVGAKQKIDSKIKVEEQKLNSKDAGSKSPVAEFLSYTSLSGFSQYGRQTRSSGRIFWLLAFVGGMSLGIYQSWGLIDDYFKYKTYQQTVTHMNATLQFPSITVCTKNPIKWAKAEVEGDIVRAIFNIKIGEVLDMFIAGFKREPTKVETRYVKELVLLSVMRHQWVEDDPTTCNLPLNETIPVCNWNYVKPCNKEKDFVSFYHVYYGQCFTYNPGFNYTHQALPSSNLLFAIYMELEEETPFLARNIGAAIRIHEAGTAPNMNTAVLKHTQAGEWMKVKMRLAKYKRLPSPYPSNCVDGTDEKLKKESLFYTEETPYRYSNEACMQSCMQRKIMKNCKCIHQKIPWFKEEVDLCRYGDLCVQDNLYLDPNECDCPFTCNEVVYSTKDTFEMGLLEHKYWQEAAVENFKEILAVLPPNMTLNKETLRSRIAVVEFTFENNLFDETQEFAKYSIADFWGAVGGNIGFWTGISALSLVEVLELIHALCSRKCTNPSSNQRNNHRSVKPAAWKINR